MQNSKFWPLSLMSHDSIKLFKYMSRHMGKPKICLGENKGADQLRSNCKASFAVTAKLISAFVFATQIVQFLFYLNPKFQASSHLLYLHRPVCVRPDLKPRRLPFSHPGSFNYVHKKQGYTVSFYLIYCTRGITMKSTKMSCIN